MRGCVPNKLALAWRGIDLAVLGAACVCGALLASVPVEAHGDNEGGGQQAPCVVDFPAAPNDYRLRDVNSEHRWHYDDNWRNHSKAAVELVQAGQLTRTARTQIEWTLFRWPNHVPVLQAAIAYDVQGGQSYGFRPVECYFVRARAFAPDDVSVLLAEGVYFWKKGQKDRGRKSFEEALSVQPDSADAHYNLGLLYIEMGRYDDALRHAWAAYAAGYPLSGLRNKLARAGHWRDPPDGTPLTTQP